MFCPDKEVLQDLVDGELPEEKKLEVMEHVKSCSDCKKEVRQMLKLCRALGQVVSEDSCPSIDTLDSYAQNLLAAEQTSKIREHIEFCDRCQSYVWLFKASPAELAQWEAQEKLSFQKFEAERIGLDTAKSVLNKLLPAQAELFGKIWESVLALVDDLRQRAEKQWPVFNSPVEFAGALGFSGSPDPESMAAAIIVGTTLATAYELTEGKLNAEKPAIARNVRQTAARFGAGKELQSKLSETVPELILKSM